MQEHTLIGDTLCGRLNVLRHVRPIVRHHHERLDGSGYPDNLSGDAIELLAQIMGVVDIYDVASDPDLKQRFEREAKPISSLNHPHICTLHDIEGPKSFRPNTIRL